MFSTKIINKEDKDAEEKQELKKNEEVRQIDLTRIPLKALNISSQHLLSSSLNSEQLITTDSGVARDYRGLAELMGFTYCDVKNFQRTTDPLKALFEQIHSSKQSSKYSFHDLIQLLEQIERFDVIDDLMPSLTNDAFKYENRSDDRKQFNENRRFNEEGSHLTLDDAMNPNDELIKYDAYICYADNDYEFVKSLAAYLESPEIGLKLFIRDRDLLLGNWEYHTFTKLIEERCNRVVIILTPDFLQSPECEYQTKFATGLAVERRCRLLIPVICKPCELPSIIKMVTKIDLVKSNGVHEWMWRKLVVSIRDPSKSSSRNHNYRLTNSTTTKHNQLEYPTLTETIPSAPPISSSKITITELPSPPTSLPSSSTSNSSIVKRSEPSASSKKSKKKWYNSIKQKITGSSNSSIDSNGYQALQN